MTEALRETRAAPAGVLDRLRALRPGLSPIAGRIADFILDHAEEVVTMSVTGVADRAGASEGSVVGLCQQVGARGFAQVKLAIARELVQPAQQVQEDVASDDNPATVLEKVFRSSQQALQDTLQVLDVTALKAAVLALRQARRIEVYAASTSGPIAEDANYRLVRLGLDCRVITEPVLQATSAGMTGPGVAVLAISHSGASDDTIASTRLAKEAGATTICITSYGRSPLMAHADVVLHTMARETRFRTEAATSRIAQLAIIDTLVSALALGDIARPQHDRMAQLLSTRRL